MRRPALRSTLSDPENVAPHVLSAIGASLEEAARAVAPDLHADDVAIHEFRKAIKRYRALVRLIEPELGDLAADQRREASDLARRLASARDMTAVLDGLHDLERRRLLRTDIDALRAAIEPRRMAAETTHLDAITRQDIGAFVTSARAALDALKDIHLPLRTLIGRIARHYQRMRRAAPRDWMIADPNVLHELRKRVVIHRYQVELLRPLWPRVVDLWANETQRLRERLGQHQDLEAIARLLIIEPMLLDARSRAKLLTALRARQQELAGSAARQHQRLAAEKPRAFAARLAGYASDDWGTQPAPHRSQPATPPAESDDPAT